MAILGIFTGEGFTKENYEELRKVVDWEHNRAAGQLFHSAGFDILETFMLQISGTLNKI